MQRRAQPPAWNEIAGNFAWDGGMLVDFYVLRPATGSWDGLLKVIRERGYPVHFSVNATATPMPHSHALIWDAVKAEARPYMEFHVGAVKLSVHFFDDEEVEVSLDRSQVRSDAEYAPLCNFMRNLGDEIGQRVILAPENSPNYPFLTYSSVDRTWVFFEWRTGEPTKPV